MKLLVRFYSFLLIAALAGCTVGPKYVPPEIDVPPNWKNEESSDLFYYDDYWWEIFNDPALDWLEEEALQKNYDLEIAYNRILESRSLMEGAESNLYPHLYLNPYYSNQGVLYESYSDGVIVRAHEMLYLLPLNLSYEVDLWGKIKSLYKSARANYESRIEAYRSTMLILTADLGMAYFQIRATDARLSILEATIKNRQHALKINQSRYDFKYIDYSDVTRAALEVERAQADYTEAVRIRNVLENRVAVLTGNTPSTFSVPVNPLYEIPPEIPAGIPSEVLKRRPDIAEAERIAASSHDLINVAYAKFFPSLSLTGVLGYSSPHIRFFLQNFSRWWGYSAGSSQMVYDGGLLSAELAFSYAHFSKASAEYREKVLLCFEEVENALSDVKRHAEEFETISKAVYWAQKTLKIAQNRYNKGVNSYLDVVISERDELYNELTQNNLLGLRFIDTIQLIKVLGGGWKACHVDD